MDDYKKFFAGFTTRRSICWFMSLGPAMALLTFYPFGRQYDWIWLLSLPLLLALAIGEYVRFWVLRNLARRRDGNSGEE